MWSRRPGPWPEHLHRPCSGRSCWSRSGRRPTSDRAGAWPSGTRSAAARSSSALRRWSCSSGVPDPVPRRRPVPPRPAPSSRRCASRSTATLQGRRRAHVRAGEHGGRAGPAGATACRASTGTSTPLDCCTTSGRGWAYHRRAVWWISSPTTPMGRTPIVTDYAVPVALPGTDDRPGPDSRGRRGRQLRRPRPGPRLGAPLHRPRPRRLPGTLPHAVGADLRPRAGRQPHRDHRHRRHVHGTQPDVLVMLFTANDQSLRGTVDVARRAWDAQDRLPYDRGGLQMVPVPSRFDARERVAEQPNGGELACDGTGPAGTGRGRRVPVAERRVGQLTVRTSRVLEFWRGAAGRRRTAEVPGPIRLLPGDPRPQLACIARLGLDRPAAESRDSFVAAAARGGHGGQGTAVRRLPQPHGPRPGTHQPPRCRLAGPLGGVSRSDDVAFGASWPTASTRDQRLVEPRGPGGEGRYRWGTSSARSSASCGQTLDEAAERLVIPVLAPGAHALPRSSTPSGRADWSTTATTQIAALAATIAAKSRHPAGSPRADTGRARRAGQPFADSPMAQQLDNVSAAVVSCRPRSSAPSNGQPPVATTPSCAPPPPSWSCWTGPAGRATASRCPPTCATGSSH